MLRRIYVVQIQPKKYVLDRIDHPAPTRQHDLDAMQIIQTCELCSLGDTDHYQIIDRDLICPMCEGFAR